MEFIVQLFRALANRTRIRILRLLCVLGELNAASIARALSLQPSGLSAHLRRLAGAGIVWRRRSGRLVKYRLAERSRHPIVAAALRALGGVFGKLRVRNAKRLARTDQASSPVNSDRALFACFTAFTHPRRLQIPRYLARRGPAGMPELVTQLSMSPRACLRHLAKLKRRGYIQCLRAGRRTAYALTDGSGPLQREIFRALRDHLTTGPD